MQVIDGAPTILIINHFYINTFMLNIICVEIVLSLSDYIIIVI